MGKLSGRRDSSISRRRIVLLCLIVGFLSLMVLVRVTGIYFLECVRMTRACCSKVERSGKVNRASSIGRDIIGLRDEPDHDAPLSLRVYVYEEDEIVGMKDLLAGRDHSINPQSCVIGQWGTEVKIHRSFLSSRFRTRDKAEANFFFVPAYVKCMSVRRALNEDEMNQKYIQVVQQMPYFQRSGGRDHVFVFPSGNGAHFFRDWALYISRSIFLTPEGDKTDKKSTSSFHTWKDIVIPGNVGNLKIKESMIQGLVAPIPLHDRKFLANYIGHAQGKAGRLKLVELAKKYPSEVEAPKLDLWGPNSLSKRDYYLHLRNAKFCFAPRGESSWTLRFFEAFFVECVPVILSDNIELPFQNVLDYKEFSIKWPATHINGRLLEYLRSIPDNAVERLIARGREVRCLWVYTPESEKCSAMTGILWELQRKVRLFQQSNETFWLHDGSVVNRDLKPIDFHFSTNPKTSLQT